MAVTLNFDLLTSKPNQLTLSQNLMTKLSENPYSPNRLMVTNVWKDFFGINDEVHKRFFRCNFSCSNHPDNSSSANSAQKCSL